MPKKRSWIIYLIIFSAAGFISCSAPPREAVTGSEITLAPAGETGQSSETPPTAEGLSAAEDTPPAAEPPPAEKTPSPLLVTALSDVISAVAKIEVQGTFIDPEYGEYTGPGNGSGFIIDPSGLAITNNHVVSGGATLKVWIGADTEQTYEARILAVSECSDLALIEIEGSDFPYLEWSDQPIAAGLEVYAAGFPFGDPDFKLTQGVIFDAQADGETRWASVNQVLEHDASINPGNSGGPLVTAGGQVVGVNYAADMETDQFFAIGRDAALPILEGFRGGDDVDSLGVNAFATSNPDGSLTGLWISSIVSGSAADQAGIEPGDLITSLAGQAVAEDGSLSAYCDIIRSEGDDHTLGVEVIRLTSNEILEGEFNGQALAVTGSFIDLENPGIVDTALSSGPYSNPEGFPSEHILDVFGDGYMAISDDDGALYIEVPASWKQVDSSLWTEYWGDLHFEAVNLAAAPDLQAFFADNTHSGIRFAASADWGAIGGFIQLLDGVKHRYSESCVLESRDEFTNLVYQGAYDQWNCGEGLASVVISARPAANPTAYLVLIQVHGINSINEEILLRALDTFSIRVEGLP